MLLRWTDNQFSRHGPADCSCRRHRYHRTKVAVMNCQELTRIWRIPSRSTLFVPPCETRRAGAGGNAPRLAGLCARHLCLEIILGGARIKPRTGRKSWGRRAKKKWPINDEFLPSIDAIRREQEQGANAIWRSALESAGLGDGDRRRVAAR